MPTNTTIAPKKDRLDQPIFQFLTKPCFKILPTDTVAEVKKKLRGVGRKAVLYLYVTDEAGKFVGVASMLDVLLDADNDRKVSDFVNSNAVKIKTADDTTLYDALDVFATHKYRALPVVDKDDVLIGMIDIQAFTEEVRDLSKREAVDELFQIIGIHAENFRSKSLRKIFLNRFQGLIVTILGGMMLAGVMSRYEGVMKELVALTVFIPVALGLAESVAIQSMTIVTHAPRNYRTWRAMGKQLFRDLEVGFLLGLACGVILGLFAYFWKNSEAVGLIVMIAITLSMMFSALMGTIVPGLVRRITSNHSVASGPVSLMVADILTVFVYLQLASFMLGRLPGAG